MRHKRLSGDSKEGRRKRKVGFLRGSKDGSMRGEREERWASEGSKEGRKEGMKKRVYV